MSPINTSRENWVQRDKTQRDVRDGKRLNYFDVSLTEKASLRSSFDSVETGVEAAGDYCRLAYSVNRRITLTVEADSQT